MATDPYQPVRVEAQPEPAAGRWLWLVKWLLVIPHVIVLVFLWAAFAVVTIVAFFAILFTARYPRALFDFAVGVLRWTWRVAYYSYGALGTDRYPPFTLSDVPDYPARLEIAYPERLSRGLVLIKWWLLAIPQYVLVGIFVGGGTAVAWSSDEWWWSWGGGLIALLTIFAGVALLFLGRYPAGIYDFVLGLDRWVIRVVAYASLMTDAYPPFRHDSGGRDPAVAEKTATTAIDAETAARARWSVGRVVLLVVGSIAALVSVGLLAAGTFGVVVDQVRRDSDGFVMTPNEDFATDTYALLSETVDLSLDGPDWVTDNAIGDIKIRSESDRPVFVGIAPAADVEAYLGNVSRAVVRKINPWGERYRVEVGTGGAPSRPGARTFWVARAAGAGEQSLTWDPRDGRWAVVVMNTDASRGVFVDLAIGAELDWLLWAGIGLLVAGGLILLLSAALIYLAVPKHRAAPTASPA